MPFTADAEWKVLQAKIERWFDEWIDHLWLGWWRIEFVWYRSEIPDMNREVVRPARKALMDCTADYHYFEAVIRVNLLAAQEFDDEYLEKVVVHELAHIVLNEMRDWKPTDKGMKREERVATHLQKMMWEAWREREGKEAGNGQAEQRDAGGSAAEGEQALAAETVGQGRQVA
jgi:hypothetical protein